MMIELTYNAAAANGLKAPRVTIRLDVARLRHARTLRAPAIAQPADDMPEIGRGLVPAQGWRAANRLLRRTEEVFAAVVLVGLLALGTLTFGYAIDGLATAPAASVPAVAVSE